MKMYRFFTLLAGMAVVASVLFLAGCSDDPEPPTASFTYVANGREVQFTSTSKNASSFNWTFGDGSTSTEQNPTHTYASFGNYTVTLSVTGSGGSATSLPDELTLAKSSAVVIDGNFSEWASIPEVIAPEKSGTITKVKVDYDALKIYFYVEGTGNFSGFMDLYLDTDNNPATGYFSGWYPEGFGADYLMEGDLAIVKDADIFRDVDGPVDVWDWTVASAVGSNAVKSSAVVTVGTGKALEFSISRAAFTNLATKFNFALVDVDGNYYFEDGSKSRPITETWATLGAFPTDNTATGKLIQVDLTK
ncbi:MAG: PKD domain-containing protein [Cytophagales bacterium]|nr:PKD domain-containing protein [Cytophagales bacterium]